VEVGDRKLQEGGNEPNFDSRFGGIKPLSRGGSRIYEMGINIRREARCRIGEHV